MIPSIRENPQHWETCVLGRHRLPGKAKITGEAGPDLDVKKSKGQDQPTITDNGSDLARLRLTWRFADKDWPEAQRIIKDLNPVKQGGKRSPVAVSHARTDFLQVSRVYIEKISTPEVDREIYTITMALLQWAPEPKPAKATKTPRESSRRDDTGAGTFVRSNSFFEPLYESPENSGLYNTGPHGARSVEDQEWLDFLDNAI